MTHNQGQSAAGIPSELTVCDVGVDRLGPSGVPRSRALAIASPAWYNDLPQSLWRLNTLHF